MSDYLPTTGLIMHKEWAQKILAGEKTWEIRSSDISAKRLPLRIGLVVKKECIGEVTIMSSIPLSPVALQSAASFLHHRVPQSKMRLVSYRKPHAWVLVDPIAYSEPKQAKRKPGQVTWIKF